MKTEFQVWREERMRVARRMQAKGSSLTKALTWWDARERGERLPEHEIPDEDPETEIWTMQEENRP